MEHGKSLSRMIGCCCQLRNPEIVGPANFVALIYPRIKVDIVPAGFTGGWKINSYISLTVETAGITDIGIVVYQIVDIGCLSPSCSF